MSDVPAYYVALYNVSNSISNSNSNSSLSKFFYNFLNNENFFFLICNFILTLYCTFNEDIHF